MGKKMTFRSTRRGPLLVVPLVLAFAGGCVERAFVITSEPSAVVFNERQEPLSRTPADESFVYYGRYRFTLVADGYETLVVEENVAPPWYEWMFIDFISENVIPWTIRDVRRFHYKLQPAQVFPTKQVLDQGESLRAKGKTVGEPLPPQPVGQPAPTRPPGILNNPGTLPVLPAPAGLPEPAR